MQLSSSDPKCISLVDLERIRGNRQKPILRQVSAGPPFLRVMRSDDVRVGNTVRKERNPLLRAILPLAGDRVEFTRRKLTGELDEIRVFDSGGRLCVKEPEYPICFRLRIIRVTVCMVRL